MRCIVFRLVVFFEVLPPFLLFRVMLVHFWYVFLCYVCQYHLLSMSLMHLPHLGQRIFQLNLHRLPMTHISVLTLLDMFESWAVLGRRHLCCHYLMCHGVYLILPFHQIQVRLWLMINVHQLDVSNQNHIY